MTTSTLLQAAALEPGAQAEGEPCALPADAHAACVTIRADFGPDAHGEVLVAIYTATAGEWDTQALQVLHLTAPGTEEAAQGTVALGTVAVEEVTARARWAGAGRVDGLRVTLTVR